jgi:hypothetical protein
MRSRVLSALPFSWCLEENDASGQGHETPNITFGIWTLPQQGSRESGVRVGLRVIPSHVSDRAFSNTIQYTW